VLHTEARRALCDAAGQADRVVLLGDVLELRQRPLPRVLAVAREPLEELGAALATGATGATGATVVLVAGNHDHGLIAPGLALRDPDDPLGVDRAHTPVAGGALATVAGWLGAQRTEIRYPGVWLRDDVWATHGHYLDRHNTVPMLERLGAGIMARVVGEAAGGPVRAEDYEAALGPLYAWLDALVASGGRRSRAGAGASARMWGILAGSSRRGLRGRALSAAFPLLVAALNRAGIGPLSADLSREHLRSGALRAMGEVLDRLGLEPAHVVFGHTHRAGPLPGDDAVQWRTPAGSRLINCGCWVTEGVLGGPDPSHSPYRAGFAVWVDDTVGTPPRLVNLLD
jgi:hypothetical protein